MNKKILLIGATGQLGSALLENAPSFGFDVVHFTSRELDVTNPAQVEEKLSATKPDIVINASAYNRLLDAEKDPLESFRVNTFAINDLARACKRHNTDFVTYSTFSVLEGEAKTPAPEDAPVRPLQMYGISKAAGEFAALAAYGERTIIIRTGGLYGGREGSRSKGGKNFVLNMIEGASGKDEMEVSGEQFMNPTYADDLSQATLKLLGCGAGPGIYHLVNEGYASWAGFAEEILRLTGSKTKIIPVDRGGRTGEMLRTKFGALANVKAKKLGVVLPDWKDGLRRYLDYLGLLS